MATSPTTKSPATTTAAPKGTPAPVEAAVFDPADVPDPTDPTARPHPYGVTARIDPVLLRTTYRVFSHRYRAVVEVRQGDILVKTDEGLVSVYAPYEILPLAEQAAVFAATASLIETLTTETTSQAAALAKRKLGLPLTQAEEAAATGLEVGPVAVGKAYLPPEPPPEPEVDPEPQRKR